MEQGGHKAPDLNSELRPMSQTNEFNDPFRKLGRNGLTEVICACTKVGTIKAPSDSRRLDECAFPW